MERHEQAYRTLGLTPGGSLEEITGAYERMKVAWDPDRFVGNAPLEARAAKKLKTIERAYLTLLEAHGIDVSEGPPPSLFDDALAERLTRPGKGRSGKKRAALVFLAMAILLLVYFIPEDEPMPGEKTVESEVGDAEKETRQGDETVPEQERPALESKLSSERESRQQVGKPEPMSPVPTRAAPIGVAFEILLAESPAAQRLVDGGFEELRYRGWKALRADPPEVTIALVAEGQGAGEADNYLWSVNLETERVRPINRPAIELGEPKHPENRPKLVREN